MKYQYEQKVWFIEKSDSREKVECNSCGESHYETVPGKWEVITYRDWNAGGGLGTPMHNSRHEAPHAIEFIGTSCLGVRYYPTHQCWIERYIGPENGFPEEDCFLTKEEAQEECDKRNTLDEINMK